MEFAHPCNGLLNKTKAEQLKFESHHIWQFKSWVAPPTAVAHHLLWLK
jgi:hypothetical protein